MGLKTEITTTESTLSGNASGSMQTAEILHDAQENIEPPTPIDVKKNSGYIHSLGFGLDCCLCPVRNGDLFIVQTTDFFYPLIENPYLMGKIACANVLSDMYAMGVEECDNMTMVVGIPENVDKKESDVFVPLLMKGFKDAALEAGTIIGGGDTKFNAWCLIGGSATSVCKDVEIIMPDNILVGDKIILTKPLGTQLATLSYQWEQQRGDKWNQILSVISSEQVKKTYFAAVKSMIRLNKRAAHFMHKFRAHGATDVTGFGLLGHASNLARHQKQNVCFKIDTLPVFSKLIAVNNILNNKFHLSDGKSIETSGGLLICLSSDVAEAFCNEFSAEEGHNAWIIGEVVPGNKNAVIVENPKIIEVS